MKNGLTERENSSEVKLPPGVKLRNTLRGHEEKIFCIAWSPDGRTLASGSDDRSIRLWDVGSGKEIRKLQGHFNSVYSIAWSPDGSTLASGSRDSNIRLWDIESGREIRRLKEHIDSVWSVTWSPDGRILASGSADNTIRLWDISLGREIRRPKEHIDSVYSVAWSPNGRIIASGSDDSTIWLWDISLGKAIRKLQGHYASVDSVAWSPDGRTLASGSLDNTIRLWDIESGKGIRKLEGHMNSVYSVAWSPDGRILASGSLDKTIRLWDINSTKTIATLNEEIGFKIPYTIAFHQKEPLLATIGCKPNCIHVWEFDFKKLLGAPPKEKTVHYTNAKVVLVGETGTGKTCLANVLMGKGFAPQKSTHGMNVWNYHTENLKSTETGEVMREVFLWDLAGQTEYQIVHQLFLDATSLGIIVFDPTHPEKPFEKVKFWGKVLKRIAGEDYPRLLTAGRIDRGRPTVTQEDIDTYCKEYGFLEYIATSAATGQGIKELREAIKRAIPWNKLSITSSPELWKDIRDYILGRRQGMEVLIRKTELMTSFKEKYPEAHSSEAEFDTVLGHAQVQGLLWKLSYGDYVLLKPEILNNYASAVVLVARMHPKGLGCVNEQDVLKAQINFEDMQRISEHGTEQVLLHAVVELFLEREVALREGEFLVFPSKFNRTLPDYPEPPLPEVLFNFTGSVESIYATLVVRLFYCGAFDLKDLWKNAAEFRDAAGNICGFIITGIDEGHGELHIFFEKNTSIESKVLFMRFIHEHLYKRANEGSVERIRIYRCPSCKEEVLDRRAVEKRLKNKKTNIPCQHCDEEIQLIDLLEEKFLDPELLIKIRELEETAEERKDEDVVLMMIKAKTDIKEFDVFLAHNSKDKLLVEVLYELLKSRGINPWLDKKEIPPGRWFQDIIQKTIPKVKSAVIIIGKHGIGRWEVLELRSFISQCVNNNIPVIPVLLPGVNAIPGELIFLNELHSVQFKESVNEPETLDDLEWGITGEHPKRRLLK